MTAQQSMEELGYRIRWQQQSYNQNEFHSGSEVLLSLSTSHQKPVYRPVVGENLSVQTLDNFSLDIQTPLYSLCFSRRLLS